MTSLSVSFHTLGCKLNQLETEAIAEAFTREGFSVRPWGEEADIYLINTCTVTSKAEQKARRLMRKTLKERPAACLIATGCYAQLDRATLEELGIESGAGRLFVVSGDAKASLVDLPSSLADSSCSPSALPELLSSWSRGGGTALSTDRFRFDANDFSFHSRAFLKIQDGCDNVCSYCRVRLARGPSVSLSACEILRRLRELEDRGYAEAVLTGINLSRYCDESTGVAIDFPALLEYLLAGTSRIALRISSTEPEQVDEAFAQAVRSVRVRPHFHLSVQSGSDAVLHRMRRRYGRSQVQRAIHLLREAKGDPFFACDLITGFPGETDVEFDETLSLCREAGFAWIHAFPFSPRPGTEAEHLPHPVPERVSVARVDALISRAHEGRTAYIARAIGTTVSAVIEDGSFSGSMAAVTENYLKVRLTAGDRELKPGDAVSCRILSSAPQGAVWDAQAEIVELL